jgi:hypothetical protein
VFSELIGKGVVVQGNSFVISDTYAIVRAVRVENFAVLLELENSITVGENIYEHAVATPRTAGDGFSQFKNGKCFGANIIWVPRVKFDQSAPLNVSWWRGGGAAVADICGGAEAELTKRS